MRNAKIGLAYLNYDSEVLGKRFYVDTESPTGLRYKERGRNPKTAHKPVGHINGYGYLTVGWKRSHYSVSRIVWSLAFGKIPEGMDVDHKDGNKTNNNPSNLQLLTRGQNIRAINKPRRTNTTGFVGVIKRTDNNCWFAQMKRGEKMYYLGNFSDPKRAARVYNDAVIAWAKENNQPPPRYLNPV